MNYIDPTPPTPVDGKFKLEAVVICVHYGDFLRETLPHNRQLFDKIVVVTSYDDKETQRICEFYHVECLVTDVMQTHKGEFHKGRGINAGFRRLDRDGWVVQMDADIWLPPLTRKVLENLHLDPRFIYGIDRYIVNGFEVWREFIENPRLQQENQGWVHTNTFPLGTRVLADQRGYVPIGFFQLFNPLGSGIDTYPEGHTHAGREDGLFALLWERAKRSFLPEIIGYHLESELSAMGVNWKGRITKRFGSKKE